MATAMRRFAADLGTPGKVGIAIGLAYGVYHFYFYRVATHGHDLEAVRRDPRPPAVPAGVPTHLPSTPAEAKHWARGVAHSAEDAAGAVASRAHDALDRTADKMAAAAGAAPSPIPGPIPGTRAGNVLSPQQWADAVDIISRDAQRHADFLANELEELSHRMPYEKGGRGSGGSASLTDAWSTAVASLEDARAHAEFLSEQLQSLREGREVLLGPRAAAPASSATKTTTRSGAGEGEGAGVDDSFAPDPSMHADVRAQRAARSQSGESKFH